MVITVISPGASKMPPHDGNVAKFTYATSLTVRDTTGILAGWHLLILRPLVQNAPNERDDDKKPQTATWQVVPTKRPV